MNTRPELSLQCIWSVPLLIGQPFPFYDRQSKKTFGSFLTKDRQKLILSVEKLESRVAVLENGRLEECSVERKSSRNIVGSVYKGKVKNIEMGLKAMFVDIGFEKMRSFIFGTQFRLRSTAGLRKSIAAGASGRENGSRLKIYRVSILSARMSLCRSPRVPSGTKGRG